MIALIQRVVEAHVIVNDHRIAEIEQGILALIGIEKQDQQATIEKCVERILNYRIFSDAQDKMNLSLLDIQGGLLLVPQFTLAADTRKGLRPSFSKSAPPADAKAMFQHMMEISCAKYLNVQSGQFGADMKVSMINDGPVTFHLQFV